jgi:hypothetical protein
MKNLLLISFGVITVAYLTFGGELTELLELIWR